MASANTFRVFVSSTFDDLVEERNRLQSEVFPELRRRCEERGFRFQAIDLRWGVPLEAGFDQRTMAICLDEIEHCREISPRPNFVVLLGDRYGWRPLPARVPEDEFALIRSRTPKGADRDLLDAWYGRDENALPAEHYLRPREQARFREAGVWKPIEAGLRRIVDAAVVGTRLETDLRYVGSATEQEIEAGALSVEDAPAHVFCFIRTIEGLPKDASGKLYVDLDGADAFVPEAHDRLDDLKERLRRRLPANCFDYREAWEGTGPAHQWLDVLAGEVRERLWHVIQGEIEGRRIDELEAMVATHERFACERAAHFTGRDKLLQRIASYLRAPDGKPLALWGEPGTGKSAVVAQAFLQTAAADQRSEVVARFVGATADSSDGRSLLDGLCRDVSRRYGESAPVPSSYRELVEELPKRLALASEERPLVVFLDAVDQLSDAEHARSLAWLPATLPLHVAIVVSTATEPAECIRTLTAKLPDDHRIELAPMPEADGARLLDRWLEATKPPRRLQPVQREEVLSKFRREGLPLYLKLAFEEARLWRSDDEAQLAHGVQGVIRENLLRRLEDPKRHGRLLVERALGYLAAGKNGLAEDELLDVLAADDEFWTDFVAASEYPLPERRLPVSVWSRLYSDLKPYLAERSADSTTVLGFYHPQLAEVVRARYLQAEGGLARHRSLVAYFSAQDYWLESTDDQRRRATILPPTPRPANVRKAQELPWQLLRVAQAGGRWDDVESLLTDLSFLESKVEAGLAFGLAEDLRDAGAGVPTKHPGAFVVSLLEDALRRNLLFLHRHPTTMFQTLWNSLWWYDCPGFADHYTVHRQSARGEPPRDPDRLISTLVQRWRFQKQRRGATYPWFRSRRPPRVRLRSGEVAVFPLHEMGVRDVVPVDQDRIASCSWDDTVRIWDVRSGSELRTIHAPGCISLAAWPQNRILAGWSEGSLRLWSLESTADEVAIACPAPAEHGLAFAEDGRVILLGGADGIVHTFDTRDGLLTGERRLPTESAAAMFFAPDGDFAAVPGPSGDLAVFAVSPPSVRWRRTDLDEVADVAWSTDGRLLAVGTRRGAVHILDARSGADRRTVRDDPSSGVASVCFSPDGRLVVAGGSTEGRGSGFLLGSSRIVDGQGSEVLVEVWDTETGARAASFWGHEDDVRAVRFCCDGAFLASASADTTIRIWDLAADPDVYEIHDHDVWPIWTAAFTPDGRIVISESVGDDYAAIETETGRSFLSWHWDEGHSSMEGPATHRFVVEAGGGEMTVRDGSTSRVAGWIPVRLRSWREHEGLGLLAGYEEESRFLHLYSVENLGSPAVSAPVVDEADMSFARLADILAAEILVGTSAEELRRRQAVAYAQNEPEAYRQALEEEIAVWERNDEPDVARYLRSALDMGRKAR